QHVGGFRVPELARDETPVDDDGVRRADRECAGEQAADRQMVAAHILVEIIATEDHAELCRAADTHAEPSRKCAPDQDSLAVARWEQLSFDETEGLTAVWRVDRERRHALEMALVADGGGENQDRIDGVDARRSPDSGHRGLCGFDAAAPSRVETHIAEAAFHALLEHLRLVTQDVGSVGHLEGDAGGYGSDEHDEGQGTATQTAPGEK